MQKRWGRKISDYGFAEFVKILEYTAGKVGSVVQKIDRYYPSSQICHVCGTKNPETKNLEVRPSGFAQSAKPATIRDRNAAIKYMEGWDINLFWRDTVRPAILVGKYRLYPRIPCL